MDSCIIKSIFLTILIIESTFVTTSYCDCEDWFPYEDEKCFKFFDSMVPQSEAVNICKQSGSILGIIRTQKEQNVVNDYIKSAKIAGNLWLGLTKINNSFEWSDGSQTTYTNWVKGRPRNRTDLKCAVIDQGSNREGDSVKWLDVNCQKKNAVLCEKFPKWTNDKIQYELLKNRRDLDNLKSNAVPIGFIYIQISGQTGPKTLWPNTEWDNISAKYSGLFFRAEGEQSSTFGQIQEQQSHSFQIYNDVSNNNDTWKSWIKITDKPLAKYMMTGRSDGTNTYGINMFHNNEEIRPRNQAIRIWQRIQ